MSSQPVRVAVSCLRNNHSVRAVRVVLNAKRKTGCSQRFCEFRLCTGGHKEIRLRSVFAPDDERSGSDVRVAVTTNACEGHLEDRPR